MMTVRQTLLVEVRGMIVVLQLLLDFTERRRHHNRLLCFLINLKKKNDISEPEREWTLKLYECILRSFH